MALVRMLRLGLLMGEVSKGSMVYFYSRYPLVGSRFRFRLRPKPEKLVSVGLYLLIYHNTIKIRLEVHIFQVSQRPFAFGNFRRRDVTSRVNH